MKKINLRSVDYSDLMDLFSWRNDMQTRQMFVNSEIISLKNHKNWFKKMINNKMTKLWICENFLLENEKIGMVRFDFSDFYLSAEISINVNPKLRGKGYGFFCVKHSLDLLQNFMPCCNSIYAKVKKNNFASLKIFQKNLFLYNLSDKKYEILKRKLNEN